MTEVVKVFTPARKVKTLIGKWGDGKKIFGGPYTPLQFGAGALMLLFAFVMTADVTLWAIVLFPAAPAVVYLLRSVHPEDVITQVVGMVNLQVAKTAGPASASGLPTAQSTPDRGGPVLVEETSVLVMEDDADMGVNTRPDPRAPQPAPAPAAVNRHARAARRSKKKVTRGA